MNTQTICILFSVLLVPVNLLCTHWMTQEAVHLTGMTYMEFLKTTSGISPTSVRRKRNWWYYVNFFNEHSTDPEKSIRFMWIQVAAALPSVAAMYLLSRVYASPDRVSFAMTGNCILLAVNLVLAAGGALYRRIHPLDPAAAEKLRRTGLDRVIREEAAQGKPILGICLGMQLLFEESREFGTWQGLGLLPGKVVPMEGVVPQAYKIPHIGWNGLHFPAGRRHPLLAGVEEGDCVYFVHSFYAAECDDVVIATAEYGAQLTAAVARGNVMGCQFHPEKSGTVGLTILKTFCEGEW